MTCDLSLLFDRCSISRLQDFISAVVKIGLFQGWCIYNLAITQIGHLCTYMLYIMIYQSTKLGTIVISSTENHCIMTKHLMSILLGQSNSIWKEYYKNKTYFIYVNEYVRTRQGTKRLLSRTFKGSWFYTRRSWHKDICANVGKHLLHK